MMRFLSKADFPQLIDRLLQEYLVIAPVVRDHALLFAEIASWEEMALKVRERQAPGQYSLEPLEEGPWFSHFSGADSIKRFLHPPRQPLFHGTRAGEEFRMTEVEPETVRMAFFGLRPCDVQAISVLDKVFLGDSKDVYYEARRKESLVITLQCTAFGENCFCTTVGSGPRAEVGFDLALTELEEGFLLETGTERGTQLIQSLPLREAAAQDLLSADEKIRRVISEMPRRFDRRTVAEDLWSDPDHPYWNEVASRCLGCTNCTMVCPTCFCYTMEDDPGFEGEGTMRQRAWDSCFSLDFAGVHGGNYRPGLRERYRHWVTHKLSTWVDQFGVLGCVGCGRCITWCPTKIDITETVRRISNRDLIPYPPG